ncbi:MAG: hypothetical protein ABIU86_14820 [Gemmatimonadaceae bacterium]
MVSLITIRSQWPSATTSNSITFATRKPTPGGISRAPASAIALGAMSMPTTVSAIVDGIRVKTPAAQPISSTRA